ncbi:MAG TPA: DUF3618 domain-containing protein [Thermoanaerobaculia bacterium]
MAQSKGTVTSNKLRSDIERTRAQMDRTFDELEQKLTPGQIMGEVWHIAKGGSTAGVSKVWQIARDYPLPTTVIGLGFGWLLYESSRGSRGYDGRYSRYSTSGAGYGYTGYTGEGSAGYGSYDENYNADFAADADYDSEGRLSAAAGSVKDAASGAADSVRHAASGAADTVRHAASATRDKVTGAADSVRDSASQLSDRARIKAQQLRYKTRYKTRQAQTSFWETMERNPLAVGVATLALGVVAGLTLPSTRKEDELMGETRDRLLEDAKEKGREVLDKGKQVASTAMDTLKDEVEHQGLTAEGLAEKVRAVGREAKNAVKEEAKNQNLTGDNAPKPGEGMTTGGLTTPSATTGMGSTPGSGVGVEEEELVRR